MESITDDIQFVHSNTYKPEHDDESNNKESCYWVCKHKKCSASLTINLDGKVVAKGKKGHNIQEPGEGIAQSDVHLP
ncbi:unnamed protein product [Brachionus calyciflorus]|uniref:FLYWCH-type domain-containing protein n=1 Tax=Brachionus calyciflorus TaxID=104777 RepID=A0A814J5W2_9BILA|nr:unnamed protein product [Brachionus calyciflorus]